MNEALKNYPIEQFTKPDPVTETKPMLNGQYLVNNTAHSILYYVDKNDPLGPAPQNPASDPQFNNWELPVQNWTNSANIQIQPEYTNK